MSLLADAGRISKQKVKPRHVISEPAAACGNVAMGDGHLEEGVAVRPNWQYLFD